MVRGPSSTLWERDEQEVRQGGSLDRRLTSAHPEGITTGQDAGGPQTGVVARPARFSGEGLFGSSQGRGSVTGRIGRVTPKDVERDDPSLRNLSPFIMAKSPAAVNAPIG